MKFFYALFVSLVLSLGGSLEAMDREEPEIDLKKASITDLKRIVEQGAYDHKTWGWKINDAITLSLINCLSGFFGSSPFDDNVTFDLTKLTITHGDEKEEKSIQINSQDNLKQWITVMKDYETQSRTDILAQYKDPLSSDGFEQFLITQMDKAMEDLCFTLPTEQKVIEANIEKVFGKKWNDFKKALVKNVRATAETTMYKEQATVSLHELFDSNSGWSGLSKVIQEELKNLWIDHATAAGITYGNFKEAICGYIDSLENKYLYKHDDTFSDKATRVIEKWNNSIGQSVPQAVSGIAITKKHCDLTKQLATSLIDLLALMCEGKYPLDTDNIDIRKHVIDFVQSLHKDLPEDSNETKKTLYDLKYAIILFNKTDSSNFVKKIPLPQFVIQFLQECPASDDWEKSFTETMSHMFADQEARDTLLQKFASEPFGGKDYYKISNQIRDLNFLAYCNQKCLQAFGLDFRTTLETCKVKLFEVLYETDGSSKFDEKTANTTITTVFAIPREMHRNKALNWAQTALIALKKSLTELQTNLKALVTLPTQHQQM